MKIVIESFVAIFFILLTVFVGVEIISGQIQINEAKTFHYNAMKGIEDSGLELEVVSQFIEKATLLGYEMTVEFSGEDYLRCGECNSTSDINSESIRCINCHSTNVYVEDGNKRGVVSLRYDVNMSLLGINERGQVEAYVR